MYFASTPQRTFQLISLCLYSVVWPTQWLDECKILTHFRKSKLGNDCITFNRVIQFLSKSWTQAVVQTTPRAEVVNRKRFCMFTVTCSWWLNSLQWPLQTSKRCRTHLQRAGRCHTETMRLKWTSGDSSGIPQGKGTLFFIVLINL